MDAPLSSPYKFINARTKNLYAAADTISELWERLSLCTEWQLPVVICDNSGEIVAGNNLGWDLTIEKGIMNLKENKE